MLLPSFQHFSPSAQGLSGRDFGLKARGPAAIVSRPSGPHGSRDFLCPVQTPPASIARNAAMKLRALLLLSCMVVVPSLAMFSHLIPAEFRTVARRGFTAATSGWLGTPAEAGTAAPLAASTSAPLSAGTSLDAGLASATTGLRPAATGATPAATGSPAGSNGLAPVSETHVAQAEPAPPPLVAQLADRTRQVRDQQARDQQAIETQLKAMGAVSFDCQPLPGAEGLHSSSCRVPVDATGQLQRVFQATGHDPNAASAALLEQVTAWRQRAALQPSAAATGDMDGGGSPPGDRFR